MKSYIKMFLLAGLPYGLIMGLLDLSKSTAENKIEVGLIAVAFHTLLLGTICLIMFPLIYIVRTRKLPDSATFEPTQSMTVELQLPLAEAHKKCLEALQRIGATIVSQDNTKIEAATPKSRKSNGDLISIHLRSLGGDKQQVVVSSKPKHGNVLLDFFGHAQTQMRQLLKSFKEQS